MLSKEEMPECPVATAVNLIGNKWKPLIIRDLLNANKDINIFNIALRE